MIDNQTNTDYSKLIKNYEIPLGGVWSLVRIQSPRLVKMKELSGWLDSFIPLWMAWLEMDVKKEGFRLSIRK